MKTNDELSPKQRVAYVLHDLFAVPFDQVAAALATNPVSAKKLASRARAKPRNTQPVDPGHHAEAIEIIEAFLAAARGGARWLRSALDGRTSPKAFYRQRHRGPARDR